MSRAGAAAALALFLVAACVATEPNVEPVSLACDPAATKSCAGACVDRSDVAFGCGSDGCAPCAVDHAALAVCLSGGGCGVARCLNRWGDCDGDPANGCERDLLAVGDCLACGARCPAGQLCSFHGCTADCKAKNRCGDLCIDPDTDERNCGGCGKVCPGDPHGAPVCVDGACVVVCDEGYARCNGDPRSTCSPRSSLPMACAVASQAAALAPVTLTGTAR